MLLSLVMMWLSRVRFLQSETLKKSKAGVIPPLCSCGHTVEHSMMWPLRSGGLLRITWTPATLEKIPQKPLIFGSIIGPAQVNLCCDWTVGFEHIKHVWLQNFQSPSGTLDLYVSSWQCFSWVVLSPFLITFLKIDYYQWLEFSKPKSWFSVCPDSPLFLMFFA